MTPESGVTSLSLIPILNGMIWYFFRYSLNIEAVSCDEMFVDCTELLTKLSMTPLEFASIIRREIKVCF